MTMKYFFCRFLLLLSFLSIGGMTLVFSVGSQNIESTHSRDFILNVDDEAGDVALSFGGNLGKYFQWNVLLDSFELNDDLFLLGNLDHGGATLTLDSDNTGAGENVSIVANQGSDGSGEIRYNATTNAWEVRNEGGSFIPLGGGGGLAPYIQSVNASIFQPSSSVTFAIFGGNFDPSTNVSIPGWEGTIDDVRYISNTHIEVDATAGTTETSYSIVVDNAGLDSTGYETDNGVGVLTVATLPPWVDLRLGGTALTHGNGAGNNIRYRSGMSLTRDANGMSFSGSNPWSSWVKFESLQWTRGTNRTVEWVFTRPDNAMMIGIGSTATNETNTAQYAQAEVEAYFQNSTTLWGLYGNNGNPGTAGSQGISTSIAGGTGVYKVKFESDGDVGDTFTLYQLPSSNPSDWDNETTVLTTSAIGGSLGPDETNIMPFIIPRAGGNQRFVAVRVQ